MRGWWYISVQVCDGDISCNWVYAGAIHRERNSTRETIWGRGEMGKEIASAVMAISNLSCLGDV